MKGSRSGLSFDSIQDFAWTDSENPRKVGIATEIRNGDLSLEALPLQPTCSKQQDLKTRNLIRQLMEAELKNRLKTVLPTIILGNFQIQGVSRL